MARQIHVSGEAAIKTGTGSSSALEDLGVSVDGVEIAVRDHTEPIFTDTFGPQVPFDEQQFLETALIRATLVFYDEAVMAKIRTKTGSAEGTMGAAGALWGAGSFYYRLLVLSPTASRPYNFPKARLLDAFPAKVGTRKTTIDCTWFAVPYTGTAGATTSAVLYNSTTS